MVLKTNPYFNLFAIHLVYKYFIIFWSEYKYYQLNQPIHVPLEVFMLYIFIIPDILICNL